MNLFRNQNKKFEEKLSNQLGELEFKPSDKVWSRIESELPVSGFESSLSDKLSLFESTPEALTWNKLESLLSDKPDESLKRFLWIPIALIFFTSTAYFLKITISENNKGSKQHFMSADPTLPTINTEKKPSEELAKYHSASISTNDYKRTSIQAQSMAVKKFSSPVKIADLTMATSESIKNTLESNHKKAVPLTNKVNLKNSLVNHSTGTIQIPIQFNDRITPGQSQPNILPPGDTISNSLSMKGPRNYEPIRNGTDNISTQFIVFDSVAKVFNDQTVQTRDTFLNKTPRFVNPAHQDLTYKYSITVISGIQMCYNILKAPANSNLDFTSNITLRRKIESASSDWSGAFLFDIKLYKNWRISSGVMITNFSQEFSYSLIGPSSSHNGIKESNAKLNNPNDSVTTGNGYNYRIKYTWTEIPLLVTYSFPQYGRIGMELTGGISYAIITGVDAGYVSYDNVGVLILPDKDAFPGVKNNYFLNLIPSVSYRIAESVQIALQPTFKLSLTSITGNSNWVQQYPYLIGMSASLRKKF